MEIILHKPKDNRKKVKAIKILTTIAAITLLLNVAFYNYVENFFNTILEAQISRTKIIVMLSPLEQIDNLFKEAEAKQNFTGAVLFAKDGNVLFEKAYGYADLENLKKNTIETKFQIASLTKSFTAMATMQLVEQGKLSLSDPIIKYIPTYRLGRTITIQNLLNHQSGIWNYPNNSTIAPEPIKRDDLLRMITNRNLLYKPGTRFMYSNSNYIMLSLIIEKASGQSYEDYVKNNILVPLEMENTGFISHPARIVNLDSNIYSLTEYDKDDLAKGYGFDLVAKNFKNPDMVHSSHVWGAGSMYSTLNDLLKWDQSLYINKLVTHDSLEQIFTPDKGKYGLGWNITTSRINSQNKILIWHQGLLSGYNCFIYRYPEEHVTVIILKNVENNTINISDQAIKLFWQSLAKKY